jgi:hypothetical protein
LSLERKGDGEAGEDPAGDSVLILDGEGAEVGEDEADAKRIIRP